MENRVLSALARKLGISDEKIISQAAEYQRRVEVRSGSSVVTALSLSSSACAVICLHLAATANGLPLDVGVAVKMSGVARKSFMSGLRAVENLLQLTSTMTIPHLAVQWGCPTARSLAVHTLQRYKSTQCQDAEVEFSDALFNSAALYAACKKLKIKVEKTKIVQTAGVKRATFEKLVTLLEKCAQEVIEQQKEAAPTSATVNTDFLKNLPDDVPVKDTKTDCVETEESYIEWRTRILTSAYASLGKTYTLPPPQCS